MSTAARFAPNPNPTDAYRSIVNAPVAGIWDIRGELRQRLFGVVVTGWGARLVGLRRRYRRRQSDTPPRAVELGHSADR